MTRLTGFTSLMFAFLASSTVCRRASAGSKQGRKQRRDIHVCPHHCADTRGCLDAVLQSTVASPDTVAGGGSQIRGSVQRRKWATFSRADFINDLSLSQR